MGDSSADHRTVTLSRKVSIMNKDMAQMGDLIQELKSEVCRKNLSKVQKVLSGPKAVRGPELTVKRFQDLRDHLADRKALEVIMSSHSCDKEIVVQPCNKQEVCQCSYFGSNFLMLLAGAALGVFAVKHMSKNL